jgi:hypothetical protein
MRKHPENEFRGPMVRLEELKPIYGRLSLLTRNICSHLFLEECLMYNEDPFDQFCRTIVAFVCFVGIILWFEPQFLLLEMKYGLKHLWLSLERSLFIPFRYKTRLLRTRITVWLMLYGFVRTPTWTEIEEMRLRAVAHGADLPCWRELEEGLRWEKQHELTQQ